jgi:hypothetical protein
MKYLLGLLATAALLWPGWAQAVDGDFIRGYATGKFMVMEYLLCDGATGGATKTCAEFNLETVGADVRDTGDDFKGGIPSYITFHLLDVSDCSGAVTVMPIGMDVTGGPSADLINAALTDAGTDQHVISPIPNRIIAADVATGTGCSDLEVAIKLYYERRHK